MTIYSLEVLLFLFGTNDAVKVPHSIWQQIWKTQQWPQDWKRLVFISIPKKDNAKECSNCRTTALISHSSKLMLKILQARLQWTMNFQMFKVVLEKAEELEIKLPTSAGSSQKQESSRETSISVLLTMPKPLMIKLIKKSHVRLTGFSSQVIQMVKNLPALPGSGRSPGEGNG